MRHFGDKAGASFQDFQKAQGKFRGADDASRAQYDAELKERTNRKLNWNIKNRWEQRQLDDMLQNYDVKAAQFRDFTKLKHSGMTADVQDFSSVDEIFYFMEHMFTEGFDESHMSIALDVFLRDVAKFEEGDLENPTFKLFIR